MIQAFDVLLQIPVTADIAAKNRIDEPFRYECLCCGEEVYIAATNSTKKAPHFVIVAETAIESVNCIWEVQESPVH